MLDLWDVFRVKWGIVDVFLGRRSDFEGLWGLYNMLDTFWSVSDTSRSGHNTSVAFRDCGSYLGRFRRVFIKNGDCKGNPLSLCTPLPMLTHLPFDVQ